MIASMAKGGSPHVLRREIAEGVTLPQSPYLHLQAAGSDGTDGSVRGVHLGWNLLRTLDLHLAKGGLAAGPSPAYPASGGFNRPDDFVYLLRAPYEKRFPYTVNFAHSRPVALTETGDRRIWRFEAPEGPANAKKGQEIVIRFDDVAQYDLIRASVDPASSPSAFLGRYTGVIEAEVPGELAFCLSVVVAPLPEADPGSSPISSTRAALVRGAYALRRRLERVGISYRRDAEPKPVGKDGSSTRLPSREPLRKQAILRVEAISVAENLPDAELSISCRRRFFPVMPICICSPDGVYRTCAENVRYFRLDYQGCAPVELQFETYQRFIAESLDERLWTELGSGFALTDDDAVAFARLEDPATGPVDGLWPRHLGADPATGLFTTSVSNYRNKWDPTRPPLSEATDADGLKRAVIEYLTLSAASSNPTATAALPSDAAGDDAAFNISYLAMLKLIGMDFHAGRMLGLGYIDAAAPSDPATARFVYLALYRTWAAVEPDGAEGARTHLFMTVPISQLDQRLPPAPVQEPPSFGISLDTGGGSIALTDADGYSLFEPSRIVNLHLAPYDTVAPFGPFFTPPVEFCSTETTKAVFYGCKYRLVGEPDDRRPELSHDTEFADGSGVAETAPLVPQTAAFPDGPVPPILSHDETEEGLHRYGFYAVNRFARHSPLGNLRDVDTHFPVRHHLLPPANLTVQLIQPEEPPILTTAAEQLRLANLPAGDTTLVRCTFDWNQVHYIAQRFSAANVYADQVHLFFRPDPPRMLQGEIKSVTALPGNLAEIRTRDYVPTSVTPPQTVSPAVSPGDAPRFVGGSFAAGQTLYNVVGVTPSTVVGEGAVFRIQAQIQVSAIDLDNSNQQSAATQATLPAVGQRFTAIENMNEPVNWAPGDPLTRTVALQTFLHGGQLHRETVTNPDGSQSVFNIGGVVDTAHIVEVLDVDPNSPPTPPEGTPVPGSRTGVYRIEFDNFQLSAHPDPDVEWRHGTVRIPDSVTGAHKALEVWSIDVSGPTLVLIAQDATFDADPYPSYALRAGYTPIATGAAVPVNFHPGYRVYLTAQAGVMDSASILPGQSQSGRQSFMAARSRNGGLAIESGLTPPVMLQARRISPPLQPGRPTGPLYATRPDPVYGKASWTMDIEVVADSSRQPYALVFYRANEQSLLDILYEPATIEAIRAALAALDPADAAFDQDRWNDLANLDPLHADLGFKDYVPGGYRFPVPDNHAYVIPGTQLSPFDGQIRPGDPGAAFAVGDQSLTMMEVLKGAIASVFLPLTETPVLYQFLKSGGQTSARKPVTRDGGGALLDPADPAFDPAPMAVRHASGGHSYVRFTDYTLDGAASNIYFYYGVELSDEMKFGPAGRIAGPVRLVNAYPAQPPAIRKLVSVLADPVMQRATAVRLLVNPYIASEGITRFNLYRATDPADAASVRSMTLVGGFDAVAGLETELVDEFADLVFPPFGGPLYYRVTALRRIVNERAAIELIPSHASEPARTSVVDVENPRAPRPGFTSDPPSPSPPFLLDNVVLSWRPVTHNATYRLFKLGPTGVWNLIYQVRSNSDPMSVALNDTTLGTSALAKQDADGNPIRHQFRLEVENASGSFSLNEAVLNVPATREDGYAMLGPILSYADDHQPAAPLADLLRDPATATFPGTMTFQDIIAALPAGHMFDRIEVSIADGLGHAARKTIAAPGGSVAFQHGDGSGIVLDGSSVNATYAVRVRLFTDACPDGFLFVYSLRFGPELELLGLGAVVDYADSQNVSAPLDQAFAAGGLTFPTTMTFTDVASLPAGHSFVQSVVTVADDLGASFSRTIAGQGGSATFVHGDGGLSLDGSQPGRVYQATVRLFTDLSPGGIAFNYALSYG
jgi:hypothetical protein